MRFLNSISIFFILYLKSSIAVTLDEDIIEAKYISFHNNEKNKIFTSVKLPCNDHNCKAEYGKCIDSNTCKCNPGFIHSPHVLSKKHTCRYKQYKWINCFLFELILPGLGIFYFHSYIYGLMKLIFIPIVYYYWKDAKGFNLFVLTVAGYSLIVIHLIDIINLSRNQIPDMNGIFPY